MTSTRRPKVSATRGSGIARPYRRVRRLSTRGLACAAPRVYLLDVARVELYGTRSCAFCMRAKRLLEARGIPFAEYELDGDAALRDEIVRRTGRRTVPQIFIDGRPIGGFVELAALDASGELADLSEVDDA